MSFRNNFFLYKTFSYSLAIILTLLALGLFNSSWASLIICSTLSLLFYSASLTNNYKRWILAIIVTLISLVIRNSLYVPTINVGSNVFIGGANYEDSIFSQKLPSIIYQKLNKEFIINFPNSISGPDKKLFEKSVTQMIYKNTETKKVTEINWKNRYELGLGSFNNTKYNAYGKQQPSRTELPYFIKYTFPKEYNNDSSKFCWKGFAYFKQDKLEEKFNKNKSCLGLSKYYNLETQYIEVWLIDTGDNNLEAKLISPLKIEIKNLLIKIIKIINSLIIFSLIFSKVNFLKAGRFFCVFLVTFFYAIYFNPTILFKFILFEGGNDGLLYVHFAHLISENISEGNYLNALRGGESAFDLMPFYRYVWVLNYLLFEEAPWMFFYILNTIPLIIFYIFKTLLNVRWATIFLFCWFLFPLLEAFGFFHFYYVKLTLRGFAEPLAYLTFFSALAILINIFFKNKKPYNSYVLFGVGLLFSLTIGLRANILPACLIMVSFILYKGILNKKYYDYFYLSAGLSLTLLIPIHNYYFSNTFVPLTIAAYKDWNLGATPSDYLNLAISILNLNFNFVLWDKIISHINDEIKLYEVWYHLSIFACIFCIFKKKTPTIIKFISISGLGLVSMLFFYHVGGRYSYLSWTLTLIVLAYWTKNFLLPKIKEVRSKYAT